MKPIRFLLYSALSNEDIVATFLPKINALKTVKIMLILTGRTWEACPR
jgi:hypothetical protein